MIRELNLTREEKSQEKNEEEEEEKKQNQNEIIKKYLATCNVIGIACFHSNSFTLARSFSLSLSVSILTNFYSCFALFLFVCLFFVG